MWGSVSFAQTGDAFYFGHISEPVFHYFYLKKLNQYFLLLPETLFTQASEIQRVCGLKVLANAKFFSEFSEIVFVVKHNGGKIESSSWWSIITLNWLTSSSCSFCPTKRSLNRKSRNKNVADYSCVDWLISLLSHCFSREEWRLKDTKSTLH